MDLQYYKYSLEKAGTKFERGLTDSGIEQIELIYQFQFPPDLREFLQFYLPTGKGWVDWRNSSFDEIKSRLEWIYEGMCFEIEHNVFWLKEWGEKPKDLTEAFEIGKQAIEKLQNLSQFVLIVIFQIHQTKRVIRFFQSIKQI